MRVILADVAAVWRCGCVVVWLWGGVAVWLCGWLVGWVAVWLCGLQGDFGRCPQGTRRWPSAGPPRRPTGGPQEALRQPRGGPDLGNQR